MVIIETAMQHIDYQEQQPIISEQGLHQQQIHRFKQYMVSSGTLEHFIKFLFGLRSKQHHDQSVPNDDALQMFEEYFGALSPDSTEQDQLRRSIKEIKKENKELSEEIKAIQGEIQAKRQAIQRAALQKKAREQQEAKNPKKGGKK